MGGEGDAMSDVETGWILMGVLVAFLVALLYFDNKHMSDPGKDDR